MNALQELADCVVQSSRVCGGKTLNVALERHFPFYLPEEETHEAARGVDVNLIATLSAALNITFNVIRPPDKRWGSPDINGTWNGMIGMVHQNIVSLAMAGMTILPQRQAVLDFSFPYLLDRTTFVVRSPGPRSPASVIIKPFKSDERLSISESMSGVLDMYNLLVGQAVLKEPETLTGRVILGTWTLLALTLSSSYSGNLVSAMTNPGFEDIVDTIPKLVAFCDNEKISAGTIAYTSEHSMFKLEDSNSRTILDCMEKDWTNFVKSDKEGLARCLTLPYAYIGGKITVDADIEDERKFSFAVDSFQVAGYGIAFPKSSPDEVTEVFDEILLKLQQGGIIEQWLKAAISTVRKVQMTEEDIEEEKLETPLSPAHIQGPMFALIAGYIAGTIAVICERCTYAYHGKQQQHVKPILPKQKPKPPKVKSYGYDLSLHQPRAIKNLSKFPNPIHHSTPRRKSVKILFDHQARVLPYDF